MQLLDRGACAPPGEWCPSTATTYWAFTAFRGDGPKRLELLHQVDNTASCRVAQKSGYELITFLPAAPPAYPFAGHLHVRDRDRRPGRAATLALLMTAPHGENSRSKTCRYPDQVGDRAKSALRRPGDHRCHGREAFQTGTAARSRRRSAPADWA